MPYQQSQRRAVHFRDRDTLRSYLATHFRDILNFINSSKCVIWLLISETVPEVVWLFISETETLSEVIWLLIFVTFPERHFQGDILRETLSKVVGLVISETLSEVPYSPSQTMTECIGRGCENVGLFCGNDCGRQSFAETIAGAGLLRKFNPLYLFRSPVFAGCISRVLISRTRLMQTTSNVGL